MPRTQQQREELGRELVNLRLEAGFKTISELAATDIGISSKTIGNAERGHKVSEQTIQEIRKFLLARRRDTLEAERPDWGPGITLDTDRYERAMDQLREWLDFDGDDGPLHPPTSVLWLWSPGQLVTALSEQVPLLERAFEDETRGRYEDMDTFGRRFGRDEEESSDDAATTKQAGESPAPDLTMYGPDGEVLNVELKTYSTGSGKSLGILYSIYRELADHGGGRVQIGPKELDFEELEQWLRDITTEEAQREMFDLAARNTGTESAGDRARRIQDEAAQQPQ